MGRQRALTEAEFWSRARRVGACLEWQRRLDTFGYGHQRWQGLDNRAHRVAWLIARGPIPPGLQVCHTCDNRRCIEPLHLFLGTRQDNMRDAKVKGRLPVGERQGGAKLTEEQVREIRRLATTGLTQWQIARQFGIAQQTVTKVVNRHSWAHVL